MCDKSRSELLDAASRLYCKKVHHLRQISGGGNSRVYRAECAGNEVCLLKHYFHDPHDLRDRLNVEYHSLQSLWQIGVRSIPQPLAADPEEGIAIYEFVEGERFEPPGQVWGADLEAAVAFLDDLEQMRTLTEANALPGASEAAFSIQGLLDNIQERLAVLQSTEIDQHHMTTLCAYLAGDFRPTLDKAIEWCRLMAQECHISFENELPLSQRMLSPSDFGFHNAIRRPNGSIVFVDFEYFGWDDPAKILSDFLLHPAMRLNSGQRQFFAQKFFSQFEYIPGLPERVAVIRPLVALKWCLILLNEFRPAIMLRRTFADERGESYQQKLREQLNKSRSMLRRVLAYSSPYLCIDKVALHSSAVPAS